MNFLFRFGEGRNDIYFKNPDTASTSDRALSNRNLRYRTMEWINTMQSSSSIKSNFLNRWGTGRTDIGYEQYIFKKHIGGVDSFPEYSVAWGSYSFQISSDYYNSSSSLKNYAWYKCETISSIMNYYKLTFVDDGNLNFYDINSCFFLLDPNGTPGNIEDFKNDIEQNYTFMMFNGQSTVSVYIKNMTVDKLGSYDRLNIQFDNPNKYSCGSYTTITSMYISR